MEKDFIDQEFELAAKRAFNTQQLLSFYRHLRHLAEIPWLLERGFKELAERNIAALNNSLTTRDHLTHNL